jgi:hypothetical protein
MAQECQKNSGRDKELLKLMDKNYTLKRKRKRSLHEQAISSPSTSAADFSSLALISSNFKSFNNITSSPSSAATTKIIPKFTHTHISTDLSSHSLTKSFFFFHTLPPDRSSVLAAVCPPAKRLYTLDALLQKAGWFGGVCANSCDGVVIVETSECVKSFVEYLRRVWEECMELESGRRGMGGEIEGENFHAQLSHIRVVTGKFASNLSTNII